MQHGRSKVKLNRAVTVIGGATFKSDSNDFVFEVNADGVKFQGMIFQGAGVHVIGPNNIRRNNVDFLDNTFQDFTGTGPGAALWIDPIHANSTVSGNIFQDIWWGGFANTNAANAVPKRYRDV